jgi:hypothetical protein
MLLNDEPGGNWLSVEIDPAVGGGIGANVAVYEPGESAEPHALLGMREITASVGYTAGSPPWAHFGLGALTTVDLRVVLPGGQAYSLDKVAANQHLMLPDGCRLEN